MRSICIFLSLFCFTSFAKTECESSIESLNRYEQQILKAAEQGQLKKMAAPLACILQMHTEGDGLTRYMSSSYIAPLLGGDLPANLKKDQRYAVITKALEQLTIKSKNSVHQSFITEFSKGDWQFYTLFCEKGNTKYCPDFLPDETKVKAQPPLIAAASMLRLRQAYRVLKGEQQKVVAERIKTLYKEIPQTNPLQRKFIDQIYQELFDPPTPLLS